MKSLILLFVLTLSSVLCAQTNGGGRGGGGISDVGGGGFGVRTQDSALALEDFVEGRKHYGDVALDMGGDELSVEEKVHFVLAKLKFYDPELFKMSVKFAQKIFEHEYAFTDLPENFELLKDRGEKALTLNPYQGLKPLAINRLKLDPETGEVLGWSVTFNRELTAQLVDRNHQAGLYLHEILYTIARIRGVKSSSGIRRVNFFLCSELSRGNHLAQYQRILKEEHLDQGVFGM